MSLSFGEIYLYSKDPAKLSNFISFVLDVEASKSEDGHIEFEFDQINFKILLSETKTKLEKTGFSLIVSALDELNEIKQLIEFYYYKEGNKKYQLPVIHQQTLNFVDPDGRHWRIDVGQNHFNSLQDTDTASPSVRIC